jgi:hypothetical protein
MIGQPKIGPCLEPARRARVAAQALKGHRAGPALSTINRASGGARVVLFRAVPRAVNRARPIWNTITTNIWPKGIYAPLKLWKRPQAWLVADGGLDRLHALSRADLSHSLSAMEVRWHAARQQWLLAVVASCVQPSTSSCRDMSPTMQCRLAGEQSGVAILVSLADRQVEGGIRAHPSCYKGRGST